MAPKITKASVGAREWNSGESDLVGSGGRVSGSVIMRAIRPRGGSSFGPTAVLCKSNGLRHRQTDTATDARTDSNNNI